MGWLKKDLVKKAYEKIGLASYVYDISPEEMKAGTVDMDAMIGQWELEGIPLGYLLAATPDESDPEDDSGLDLAYNQVVFENLAIKLAEKLGRPIGVNTVSSANRGRQALMGRSAAPGKVGLPGTMPAGAGAKTWRGQPGRPFLQGDGHPIGTGGGGKLPFK